MDHNDNFCADCMVGKTVEMAMNQHPWDAGFRADFYREVAEKLNALADQTKDLF